MKISNYIFFTTCCEEALGHYARCGLGRVTEMRRYDMDGVPAPTPGMRGKVMHSRFEGPGVRFYASDNHDAEPHRGFAHLVEIDTREELDRLFIALADGGTVTTPLGVQPWGDYYVKFTDRFGVQWMLDCAG